MAGCAFRTACHMTLSFGCCPQQFPRRTFTRRRAAYSNVIKRLSAFVARFSRVGGDEGLGFTGCCCELVLIHLDVWQQKYLLQPTPLEKESQMRIKKQCFLIMCSRTHTTCQLCIPLILLLTVVMLSTFKHRRSFSVSQSFSGVLDAKMGSATVWTRVYLLAHAMGRGL